MTMKEQVEASPEAMDAIRAGWDAPRIMEAFGFECAASHFRRTLRDIRADLRIAGETVAPVAIMATGAPVRKDYAQTLREAQINPPVDVPPPNAEIDALRRELALLREQLTWAQRADTQSRTGGKATVVCSDLHFGDRSHMGRCFREMRDKVAVVLKQYEPTRILILHNGDAVAGRGIYREQNMDAVLQSGDEQNKVAAWNLYEWDRLLKEQFPQSDVTHRVTRGNHDMAMREPLAPQLVLMLRSVGVAATYCGDNTVVNLSSSGYYFLYAEHGYGYSSVSPSSPKWLNDMKDKLLMLSRKGYNGEKAIRRITHGHTHWHQLNMERIAGYYYDCTGGTQKNERVLLGKNLRPMGMNVYLSPDGYEGILEPIGVQPSMQTTDAEIDDPYLMHRNMQECSEALQSFEALLKEKGLVDLIEPEGR